MFDLRALDAIDIDRLTFDPLAGSGHDLQVLLSAAELTTGGGVSPNLQVTGVDVAGHQERIDIFMDGVASLNISGWTFVNWGTQDEAIHIFGDADNESITGSGAHDVIHGNEGNDILNGGAGDDLLLGGIGKDGLYGGFGDDTLKGHGGVDYLRGGDGADTLLGGGDADTLRGDSGDDRLYGQNGDDTLKGDDGDDRLKGNAGNDTLYGGLGRDHVFGDGGDDTLYGNKGDDRLYGGAGNDVLNGNNGNDRLWGQAGADTFRYNPGGDSDVIRDFEDDVDALDLSAWGFTTVNDALVHATLLQAATATDPGIVRFDFTAVAGAGPTDKLWVVANGVTSVNDLANDIIV